MSRNGIWASAMYLASVFSSTSPTKSQEHRSKDASRWVLVASWGHLPRHEGVWGGCWSRLGGSWGLRGAYVEAQGCPSTSVEGKVTPVHNHSRNSGFLSARRNARGLSGDFNLLSKAIRLLRQTPTRLCARRGRAVFNRSAHSGGPGHMGEGLFGGLFVATLLRVVE